jgi:FkbM family methyltransferase
MKKFFDTAINSILRKFNRKIVRLRTYEKLVQEFAKTNDIALLLKLPTDALLMLPTKDAVPLIKYFTKSTSQLRQDLFVLAQLNFKTKGYFVEFGAANGIDLSNSYLMEKEFGWTGILAEPAKCWHVQLKRNRKCNIETDCVWKDSVSTITFNEVGIGELSTIDGFGDDDEHQESRKRGAKYSVKTISLNDLLEKYKAPHDIDYLSIDTEGSEYEILSNVDFSKYSFKVITVEHNYTPMREKILDLLTKNGYKRVFEDASRFDDWYIRPL